MKQIIHFLQALFTTLFGTVDWQMPNWLKPIVTRVQCLIEKGQTLHRANPGRSHKVGGVLLVFVLLCSGGYHWYSSRPQPVRMGLELSEITATPLEKDAKPVPLKINFKGSAAKLSDIGKIVKSGVRIEPELPGEWKWESEDTLVFTIEGDWSVAQEHTVVLEKKLFPKHVKLEAYELPFQTPSFEMAITSMEFYQNPKNSVDKKVVAEIKFSHPVDTDSLKKRIKMKFYVEQGKDRKSLERTVDFKVSYDEFVGKAFVHSERLSIPKYEGKVRLDVDEGVISSRGGSGADYKLSDTSVVPGMLTHFRVTEADLTLVRNKKYEPEQALVFTTTTGVSQKDLTESISVYALPKDRPPGPGRKRPSKNYRWSVSSVSKEVLKTSQKVELEEIPIEKDHAIVVSYKFKTKPGTYLFIRINKGLKAFGGYELAESAVFVKKVPEYPRELKIMGTGSLLSLSGSKKMSILARDVGAVRFRAQRVLPGQIAHLVTQSSGSFGNPNFSYDWKFGFENITKTFKEVKRLPRVGYGKTQYSHFDFTNALIGSDGNPKGLFHFVAESWDHELNDLESQLPDFEELGGDSYYDSGNRGQVSDQRLILITDIGILEKKSVDGTHDLFLQSIETGLPHSGVTVEVLGKNGLPIEKKVSNQSGHVQFTDLDDYEDEESPSVFIATKGTDLSFLPYNSHVSNMNFSRFDVGGVHSRYMSSSLQAYLFSDRGIYRPGEKIHLGYVVKDSEWARDLSGLSVEMEVTDPKGTLLRHEEDLALSRVGLQSYDFQTGSTWATGYYSFRLYLKEKNNRRTLIGSTQVKVEEFMPDRLKIVARFSVPPQNGWIKPEGLKGLVSLKNLFGTAAQNRKVAARLALSPTYPSFPTLREWTFFDPKKAERSFDESLGEKKTDNDGMTEFDLGLTKFESASYLLRFSAEGFEAEGGRSVKGSVSTLISPLDYLVGYKKGGDLSFIKKNAKVPVEFIAVDSELNRKAVKGLKLKFIEFRKVSTLVKQSNGTYKYESVDKEYEKGQQEFAISVDKTKYELTTSEPGDFAIVVLDKNGLELNRVKYSVAGASNLTYDLEKNAELQVRLNKKDFNPGETIEISVRGPYAGAGLITIEREKVYAHKWFKSSTRSSVQKIKIPNGLEGNGYVNVTFVRSISSDEIFMSPLSSGVASFSINKASRVNKIDLKIPPLVRPGKDLAIKIKAQKKGKAIVFAVNEGILQVANYKNPDPLGHFYKKRALEVNTRQILDLILPEFAKLAKKRSSEACGMAEALAKLADNQNPFKRLKDKAVAYWSGIVDVGPDGKVLKYNVPDYFAGQLRVLAVVVSPDSMDATSDKTLVRGHFVLSPNVPTFVAPGDKLKVSVGVSNNVEKSGKQASVDIEISTSKNIKVLGDNKFSLKIDEGNEDSITFDVEVKEPLGNANFMFKATSGDKSSQRTVTTSVRPASPFITRIQAGYVDAGKDKSIKTPRRMYKEFRTNEVSVSKLPLSIAKGFMDYLEKYPYGCTEQITSKGFPALVLSEYKEFKTKKSKVAEQVQGMTELYASRQNYEGGLASWPGGGAVNVFHTAYAVHFLTEAKDRGHRIPANLMDSALKFLKEYSEQEPKDLAMARVQGYAAYLVTRNEQIATQSLTTLERWLDGYKDKSWVKDVLLLYMAAAYKNMQANQKANQLLAKFDDGGEVKSNYSYGIYDDAIKRAAHLYLIAKHFPERIGEFNGEKLQILVDRLNKGYNTTSSALAILAFQAYAKIVKGGGAAGIKLSQLVDNKTSPLEVTGDLFPKSNFEENSNQVDIENSNSSVAFYSLTQAGFDQGDTPEITDGVEVFREFLNPNGDSVSAAKIGEEITVRLRLRILNRDFAPSIAIVDLLPGGFEVVIDSVDAIRSSWEYVDAREDRVLVFSSLSSEAKTFEYKIKAINKGTYKVPPIFAESMYDRSIQTKGQMGSITVE